MVNNVKLSFNKKKIVRTKTKIRADKPKLGKHKILDIGEP
jgi:hypothetical protein